MAPTPDKLELRGDIQIDTAVGALIAAGAGLRDIARILNYRFDMQPARPSTESDEPIVMSFDALNGGEQMKSSILKGLEVLVSQATTPEQKKAAQALREIIQEQ